MDSQPARLYAVRIGLQTRVGRFQTELDADIARGTRLVCRTPRGIEVGHCLAPLDREGWQPERADGQILRRMTAEDELLWAHLHELSQETYRVCNDWLNQQGSSALLLEVEPLLDGRTLFFHFLSDVDADVQQHLDHLVELFEQAVRQSKFAQLLEHGCGPGCGTAAAEKGCGTSAGGCAVCKVASACSRQ